MLEQRLQRGEGGPSTRPPPSHWAWRPEEAPTSELAVVFRYVANNASHPRTKARGQLLAGALFFAFRGCKYPLIDWGERKTRVIEVRDIVFTVQHETFCNIPAFNSSAPAIQHHLTENQGVHSPKHHRRDIHKAVFGRQGSLRRALQPRN